MAAVTEAWERVPLEYRGPQFCWARVWVVLYSAGKQLTLSQAAVAARLPASHRQVRFWPVVKAQALNWWGNVQQMEGERAGRGRGTYWSVQGCNLALGSAWWIAAQEGRVAQALGVGDCKEDSQNYEDGRHVADDFEMTCFGSGRINKHTECRQKALY